MIVSCLAFHKAAVELPEIGVFEAFAEALKPLATPCFDEGEDEQAVEKAFLVVRILFFKFHQFIDIGILALAAEFQPAFLEFGEDEAEMAPFFGDDGGEVRDEAFFGRVALDERDAAGRGFLFAPGVVGEDVYQGDAGKIDPARVGGELKAEDVLLAGGGFHEAKLRRFAGNFAMGEDRFLDKKLAQRREHSAFRTLRLPEGKVDFCSNDYLGVARNGLIERAEEGRAAGGAPLAHGSAGSRLLAGNYALIEETERQLAVFHASPAGLIYNSGYDANVGVLSCVPQRGDVVLYDALCHASIRDGMRLSFAQAYSFAHNDCADLEKRLAGGAAGNQVFVVTESVFSMDGDCAPLEAMAALCLRYGAHLIVDEAHATGIIGAAGEGLVQALGLADACFARIHTFGKAVGCHGAIVLGSPLLRDYLINFSRSFIYTTALPPAGVRAISTAYALLPGLGAQREQLRQLIDRFRSAGIGYRRLDSLTPIQVVIVPGNEAVRGLAQRLQDDGLDVRPILYPTVPKGGERLRIVLHAFNTPGEVDRLCGLLAKK